MPAARLVSLVKSNGHCECIVEKRAGWLCWTFLDFLFLAVAVYLAYYSVHRRLLAWTALFATYIWAKRNVTRKESILALKRIGVQLSSSRVLDIRLTKSGKLRLPLSGTSKSFIPATTIQDVLLLEGIQGWTVIWYLAILQDAGEAVRLRVAFQSTLPRLAELRQVRKGIREVLYG